MHFPLRQITEGLEMTAELKARIVSHMKTQGSPRHVPDEIHRVPAIPQTRNAKKAELVVEKILQGPPYNEYRFARQS